VRLSGKGPIFFVQPRTGFGGRRFNMIKFRTMVPGAADMKADLLKDHHTGGPDFKILNDPRVTRVGRLLRRSRLDELPQLYNVLVGQMSIIGPRPERPDIVEELAEQIPYYRERHLVKPGITGWAQIGFRYGSSIADAKRKLQFDLYYLKEMSFEMDMIILLRTVGTFLRGGI